MISIHMGSRCLLKAERKGEGADAPLQDLVYGAVMKPGHSLASLFDDQDIQALTDARCLQLTVNGDSHRTLEIRFESTDIEDAILVTDEMGRVVDFHDVTLGSLIQVAEEEPAPV